MRYEFNFGSLGTVPPRSGGKVGERFRLAVLGDFSARANRGEIEVGETLAGRKPLLVDIDNFDQLMGRLGIKLQLDIGGEDGTVDVAINSIDDFHPDQLYDNLELFSHLSGLRQRLDSRATFAKAAKEVQGWPGVAPPPKARKRARRSRGMAVAADCKLGDFARLLERSYEDRQETPVDQLLQRVVAPHVVPAKDPRQDVLIAAVDSAISETMRRVLHHPDFQTTEALWRSVDLLIRRLETGVNLQIVLYDITAEELAADLSATETLEETGLYRLLVEQPALDARQGAISAIVGNYLFEHTPPHAELLGRMGKIAAAAKAPFIAAISASCLQKSQDRDLHALIADSWSALSKLPEAAYLGLTVPRFLLRNPYGQKTDPIDRFEFEEFTPQYGLRGMLWGNSAILAGLLLGQTCARQGLKKMNIGSILSVNEMPYYYYTDRDGDQVALPCTERLLDVRTAAQVSAQGWIPVLSIRGRAEVRLGGLLSLAGTALSGPWPAPAGANTTDRPKPPAAEAPAAESEEGTAESELDAGAVSDDLDLGSSSDESSETPAADSGDSDLDALLASMGGDDEAPASEAASSEEMDPELAALLASL